MKYFKRVLFIAGNKNKIFWILLCLFILNTFFETLSIAIIIPYLSMLLNIGGSGEENSLIYNFITKFKINQNIEITFSLFIVGIFSIKFITSLLNIYIINHITWKQIVYLRIKLLNSFQNMKYSHYINKNSSHYINLIEVLSKVFIKQTFFPIVKISSDIILLFSIIILLATINIHILGASFAILILFMIIFDSLFKAKIKKYGFLINKENENIFKNINEIFYGFKEIKILKKLSFYSNRIILSSRELANKQIKVQLISASPRYIYEYLIALFIIVFVLFYSNFFNEDLITIIPLIAVFIVALLRILPIISSINQNLTLIRAANVANNKIYDQLKLTENINQNTPPLKRSNSFNSIEFKNITFGYNSINILENINFKIKAGEIIGVIGMSGSGKSTFVDILLGLLSPNSGHIYLNDKEINNIDLENNPIADLTSYLPQDNFIFDDSLIKNISLTEDLKEIDRKKISNYLNKLNLQFEMDHKLGDRGSKISGGQRQRVSIARALYHNKDILIMDESTSALDEKTENEILEYLKDLKNEITIILISHKKETLKYCDRVYKISKKKMRII